MTYFRAFFVVIIAIICCHETAVAQIQVETLEIEGLKKCKPDYLLNFVKCEPNCILDSVQLNEDVQRLRNLNGISEASYSVAIVNGKAQVKIECRESLTLLPLFGFGVVKGNTWFRAGAFDVNLAGRGIILKSYYQYNQRHSFSIRLRVPFVKKDKWGVLANFETLKFIEPLNIDTSSVFYNFDNNRVEAGGIYHVNENQNIDFSANYLSENYAKRQGEVLNLGPSLVKDELIALRFVHRLKHIDYFEQHFSGWSNEFVVQGERSILLSRSMYSFSNTSKYFKRFNRTNFAFRLKFGLSTNSEKYFTPFVLDSYFNIRGSGNRVDRGTGVISLNSEVRQTVLENGFGAIQVVGFTDMGTWRKSEGTFNDFTEIENVRIFSGLGLRFIYKHAYKTSLRIDYGVNLLDTSYHGIVVGIGQYF